MTRTVSDFLVDRLAAWGVDRIFGYPGDGINGVIGALGRARGAIEFVLPRHEEMGAFMACGHAKFTGRLGVCLATSGPGAIHLLNGLYDARLDRQPVLALVGQQARRSLGADYQQEVDLLDLFADVAAYRQQVVDPAQARHVLDRAVRIALGERAVTCLILPKDVQDLPEEPSPPRAHGSAFSGVGWSPPVTVPRPDDLRRAADVLSAGSRVAILAGAGALQASAEVEAVAERLDAGVAKALLGRAAPPDDLPYVTGAIGMLGTPASWSLMQACDTLLIVGSGFPYAEFLPPEGQARAVQVDVEPGRLALRYPVEVGLVGDSASTLRALLPLLERRPERAAFRRRIEAEVADWWALAEGLALVDAEPVNPQRVFHELSPRLPDRCIVAGDSGSTTVWIARHLRLRRGMALSLSGTLASMGSALPYGIAAKLAHPDRPVIAIAGDGAMQMNGLAELLTVAEYAGRWGGGGFVVLVLHNRDLSQVTWEQRMTEHDRRFGPSQELPDVRYADHARLMGLAGARVERPEDVGPAWDEALASTRPYVLEVVTDPNVPPLPPNATPEDLRALADVLAEDRAAGTARGIERLRALAPVRER